MAMVSVICIIASLISLMYVVEGRIPGAYTGGAWQSAHATFYGGSDASGNMAVLPQTKLGETWCVPNETAGEKKLRVGLDIACGKGGIDCGPIQPGGTCYNPNTIVAHAVYAFNSYYQKKGRAVGSCNFDGAAHVVTEPPKYEKCEFLEEQEVNLTVRPKKDHRVAHGIEFKTSYNTLAHTRITRLLPTITSQLIIYLKKESTALQRI